MGLGDRDAYRGYINDVLAFLSGDVERLLTHLHRRLEDTVRTLDFERAAKLRDQILRVDRLVLEQVRLNEAARHGEALLVLNGATPGTREVWYLVRGQRWAALTVEDASSAQTLARRLAPIAARARSALVSVVPNHHSVDEMSLIARWMRKTPDHDALIPIAEESDFERLAQRILSVDLTKPFGDVVHNDDNVVTDDEWSDVSAEQRSSSERLKA
jgi:excinuclease UvrABC nuclease subunit